MNDKEKADIKEKNIIKNIFSEGKIKKCLFCGIENNIADCHTIQENKYLDRISDNELIYTFNYDNKGKKLEFKVTHKGKSEFGIFNGFCKEHDTKLFLPIENGKKFIQAEEQLFLFAFRSFCYRYHKEKELILSDEKFEDKDNKYTPLPESNIGKILNILSKNNLNYFIQCLKNKNFDTLETFLIEIPFETKIVVSNSFIPPEININIKSSTYLDPFSNLINYRFFLDKDSFLPYIYFNVFPEDKKTFLLFSYFKESKNSLDKFLNEIKDNQNDYFWLSNLILNYYGNLIGFSKNYLYKIISDEKINEILKLIKERIEDNQFKDFEVNLFQNK
ncbi:hypothetical protein [Fusobacterium polymorphum]|uniref:hypothetical protein n=1 Tax=Fusobacterium nucleatum subsp. polymorphum TaxID=76857 RepID=UPI003245D216